MLGTVKNPKFRVGPFVLPAGIIVGAVALVLRLIGATLRVRLDDRAGFLKGTHPGSYIFIFWHNQMIGVLFAFRKFYHGRKGAVVLTSASGEGTVLSRILASFGIGAVRGSSSRQGTAAAQELIKILRSGRDVNITPDGPRGPVHQLALGPVFIAYKTTEPLLIMRVEYSRCVRLRTWDGFMIPLPFSRVDVTMLPLEFIEAAGAAALESERARIEKLMLPLAP
jgi:lysophospholipid acyltransferase (LPLAT)-like uncharacterized protein